MPQQRGIRTVSIFSKISFPSTNTYLTFSAVLFLSGLYYYYKVVVDSRFMLTAVSSPYENETNPDEQLGLKPFTGIIAALITALSKYRLLFYILINTCCALICATGKILMSCLYGALAAHEHGLLKKSFRRFVQTKLTFLVFISHHNLFEDILVWLPWLALCAVFILITELASFRMSNPLNIVSNRSMRRRLFAANFLAGLSSIIMATFVLYIYDHINMNYALFMISDCCLLLVQSVHLLFKLSTIVDSNSQRGQVSSNSSYYVDLVYDLAHDSIEFANYLHMIFFSQLAFTYCCVFLVVQARHYYTRISTKIQKHWQHQEIVRHINNCYGKATGEDLLKNSSCTICWQNMREDTARKLPCGHVFHELCLRRWLEQDSSCAICRQALALNLNHELRNGEAIGEEMDNAVQHVVELFSPVNNRIVQWWTRLLFDSMNDEQVNQMINHVAEMFPQVPRETVADIVRSRGSITAAVDALLEGAGRPLNTNAEQNRANDVTGGAEQNTSSDEADNTDVASVSSDSTSSDNNSDSENAIDMTDNVVSTSPTTEIQYSINPNTWIGTQYRIMVEENRRKYIQSSRADDIRPVYPTSS